MAREGVPLQLSPVGVCFGRLGSEHAARDNLVGAGGVEGARRIVNEGEPQERLHIDIMRHGIEWIREEDEEIDLSFRDHGADLLVAAERAGLHESNAEVGARIADECSGRRRADQLMGAQERLMADDPVSEGLFLFVMSDDGDGHGHGGIPAGKECCGSEARSSGNQQFWGAAAVSF